MPRENTDLRHLLPRPPLASNVKGSAGNLSCQLNAMSDNMPQANHNRRLKDTLLGVLIALVTAAVISALYLIYLLWPL